MSKWNVNINGTFEAKDSEQAKKILLECLKKLEKGDDLTLSEGESFNLEMNVNIWGE